MEFSSGTSVCKGSGVGGSLVVAAPVVAEVTYMLSFLSFLCSCACGGQALHAGLSKNRGRHLPGCKQPSDIYTCVCCCLQALHKHTLLCNCCNATLVFPPSFGLLAPQKICVSFLGVGLPRRACNLQHACVCRNVRAASPLCGLAVWLVSRMQAALASQHKQLWCAPVGHARAGSMRAAGTVCWHVQTTGSLEECMRQGARSTCAPCCILWLATAVCNSVGSWCLGIILQSSGCTCWLKVPLCSYRHGSLAVGNAGC